MKPKVKRDVIILSTLIGLVFYGFLILHNQPGNKIVIYADESLKPSITATPAPELSVIDEEPEKFKSLYQKIFGEVWEVAFAIGQAESNLNPDKCHIDEIEYSCGLMQINLRAHFEKVPGDSFEEKAEWLKVPENNLLIAKFLYGASKWQPWSTYTNKAYLKFYGI